MSTNPLSKHFRQPSIYISLPSKGSYWKENSIELPINSEIPVFPMTTMDELLLKTPDALMNGSGVVEVIQSCCPNIKNAWDTPSIDVDAILISIRIATIGDRMDFDAQCPHCKHSSDYAVSLGTVLSGITAPDYVHKFEMDNLKFKLKPQLYFEVNKSNQITFQQEKLLNALRDETISDDDRKNIMDTAMRKINELGKESCVNSVEYIETEDGTIVNDRKFIAEYFDNSSANTVKTFNDELRRLADIANLKPISLVCENEECKKEFKTQLTFDYSDFFGNGS